MREYLLQNGYTLGDHLNEWVKGTWTIRLDGDYIEAFQDLSTAADQKYILWLNDFKNLQLVVEEIDKL